MIRRLLVLCLSSLFILSSAVALGQEADPALIIHVVQRGETLFRIALNYGVTVEEIAALNAIVDPSSIQVGQRLLVPDTVLASSPVAQTHVVQPGETLRSIAELYNLSMDELVLLNNVVNPDSIYVGQILNLFSVVAETPTLPVPTLPVADQSVSTVASAIIHTVQPGETLFRIATSYGLTVNDLATANSIGDPTLIYSGQQLIIPGIEAPQLALDLPSTVTSLDIRPLIFVEGQTGRIRLTTSVPMTISGLFLERGIVDAVEQGNTVHTILVGVPIFTAAGIYPLSLVMTDENGESNTVSLNIQIVDGNYGSEYINLLADRANLLDPNVETAELNFVQSVMSNFSPTHHWNGPMGLPAAASIVSPFGRKRSYDGGPFNRFHSGTDFGGAPGTPILSAAPGSVMFVGPLDVRGNATIIDHGWGVFTGYWHQTEQYVRVGDFVSTGQVIGTIGSTGRVTGPHLHWELWVNGVPVDPMQWVSQSFS